MQCTRALLAILKQLDTTMADMHNNSQHLIEVMDNQVIHTPYNRLMFTRITVIFQLPLISYVMDQTELRKDESALSTYAQDPSKFEQAVNACNFDSPMAIRQRIVDTILKPSFSGRLIPALQVKANCNQTIYSGLVTFILNDIVKLTALEEVCHKILKKNATSSKINKQIAGE
jgi:hypothetical protein